MTSPQPNDQNGERPREPKTVDEPVVDPRNLTPEEQMERYEQELKDSDWGHQPC